MNNAPRRHGLLSENLLLKHGIFPYKIVVREAPNTSLLSLFRRPTTTRCCDPTAEDTTHLGYRTEKSIGIDVKTFSLLPIFDSARRC